MMRGYWHSFWTDLVCALIMGVMYLRLFRQERSLRRQLKVEVERNRIVPIPMKSPMGDTYSLHGTCKHCGAGCSLAVVSVPR